MMQLSAFTHTSPDIRIFSFGGGVQSHAVLAMQAMGLLAEAYDVFVMANVGHDSENPATLEYLETHTKPFAARHGIRLVILDKYISGRQETLRGYVRRMQRSVPIPVYMDGGAPGNRKCTSMFKIEVVDRWARALGVDRVTLGLGISIDEFQRAKDTLWHTSGGGRNYGFAKRRHYPLLEAMASRDECHRLVTQAGLPTPPKSSCWFCPFKSKASWVEMRRTQPELFQQAVALEDEINAKRVAMGRDNVYLHSSGKPLIDAVPNQMALWEDDQDGSECESGYCFT